MQGTLNQPATAEQIQVREIVKTKTEPTLKTAKELSRALTAASVLPKTQREKIEAANARAKQLAADIESFQREIVDAAGNDSANAITTLAGGLRSQLTTWNELLAEIAAEMVELQPKALAAAEKLRDKAEADYAETLETVKSKLIEAGSGPEDRAIFGTNPTAAERQFDHDVRTNNSNVRAAAEYRDRIANTVNGFTNAAPKLADLQAAAAKASRLLAIESI